MKKQPFVVALIAKDAVEHLPVTVGAHELPILAAVHGESRVFVDENADLPVGLTEAEFEPEDEYPRLEQFYGIHPDTKQSFASMVFGGLRGFVKFLDEGEAPVAPPKGRAKKAEA